MTYRLGEDAVAPPLHGRGMEERGELKVDS